LARLALLDELRLDLSNVALADHVERSIFEEGHQMLAQRRLVRDERAVLALHPNMAVEKLAREVFERSPLLFLLGLVDGTGQSRSDQLGLVLLRRLLVLDRRTLSDPFPACARNIDPRVHVPGSIHFARNHDEHSSLFGLRRYLNAERARIDAATQ